MAVKLIANYAKRLGLPGYSSHQFSVSVETELTNVEDVAGESARLYQQLQGSVDQEIQQTGFVPPHEYGMAKNPVPTNGAAHRNGNGNGAANGNVHATGNGNGHAIPLNRSNGQRAFSDWRCTDGQRGLILRLVEEGNLNKDDVEAMAQQLFGAGVREIDKMQASQLIEELLEKTGKKTNGRRSQWQGRQPARS